MYRANVSLSLGFESFDNDFRNKRMRLLRYSDRVHTRLSFMERCQLGVVLNVCHVGLYAFLRRWSWMVCFGLLFGLNGVVSLISYFDMKDGYLSKINTWILTFVHLDLRTRKHRPNVFKARVDSFASSARDSGLFLIVAVALKQLVSDWIMTHQLNFIWTFTWVWTHMRILWIKVGIPRESPSSIRGKKLLLTLATCCIHVVCLLVLIVRSFV